MSKQVYIVNKEGQPLMPTTRNRHVRILLKEKKARVFKRDPFTIQLLYDSPSITQDLYLGIDPGRTNIGVSVIKESGESVYTAQLVSNNKEIKKHMDNKRMYRRLRRNHRRLKRQRRAIKYATTFKTSTTKERYLPHYNKPITIKEIKNKEARFCNRKTTIYSIPTFNHCIQTHINLVKKIFQILPITSIIIEANKFDFQRLENPTIRPEQYSRGTLHGFQNTNDYIYQLQGGKCLLCNTNNIDHYHHIKYRSQGGSNNQQNIVGVCLSCHQQIHQDKQLENRLQQLKSGIYTKYSGTSVLNSCLPYIIENLYRFKVPVYTTTGLDTQEFRVKHSITKSHHNDSYCIASYILSNQTIFKNLTRPIVYKQYRRHQRALKMQQNLNREYWYKGKVAINRGKSSIQQEDSLKEFRENYAGEDLQLIISRLKVMHKSPVFYKQREYRPGSQLKRKNTKKNKYTETYVLDTISNHKLSSYNRQLNQVEYREQRIKYNKHNSGIVCISS